MAGKNGFVLAGTCVLAAATVATGVVVGARGSSGTVGAPGTGSAAAADSSAGVTTLSQEAPASVLHATSKAVAGRKSAKMKLTMHMGPLDETASGAASFDGTLAAQMTVHIGGQSMAAVGGSMDMEMRMNSDAMYMKSDLMTKNIPDGKPWMKISYNDLASIPGLKSMSYLKDMAKQQDPGKQINGLLTAPNLAKVGVEQHGGVSTVHYAGDATVDDLAKATAAGTGLTSADLQQLRDAAKTAGLSSMHYDVWVDGAGLPVEVKVVEQSSVLGQGTIDIVYSDWGVPVTVQVPPTDQVTDMGAMMAGLTS